MLIKTKIVLGYFPSGLSAIKIEETRRSPSKDFISVQYNHLWRKHEATIFPANFEKKVDRAEKTRTICDLQIYN